VNYPASTQQSVGPWLGGVLAVIATLAALLLRFGLDPFLGDHLPYVTFFVAVAAVAWCSRALSPCVIAIVLGAIAAQWFFAHPRHSLKLPDVQQQVGLATYFMVTLTFVGFGRALHRSRRRAEELAHERDEQYKRSVTMNEALMLGSVRQHERHEGELRFRKMADAAPAMLWVTEPDSSCSFLSRGWYEYTGQTEKDALGFGWLNAIHPDDRESAGKIFQAANRHQHAFEIDFRLRRANGKYRWCIDKGQPRVGDAGDFLGFTGSVIDVHERKQAERALSESEERFRTLVEQVKEHAIFGTDIKGRATTWNEGVRRVLGFEEHEFLGKDILSIIFTPEDVQSGVPRQELDEAAVTGSANNDRWMRRKDGTRFWAVGITTARRDEHGRLIGFTKVMRDRTERKRAEQALHDSEERFRMLADNMSQLAWACDQLGNVTWYNRRWLDYTGLSFEEMREWGWMKVHHPDHIERVVANITRSRESGQIWEDTFPLRGKDGQYRWFLSRAYPIRNAQGEIVRWFGTNTDITDLRETEAKLAAANEQLASRAKHLDKLVEERTAELKEIIGELEAFSYSMAHDLRGPLRSLHGFASLLRSDYSEKLDATGRDYLERLSASTVRMQDLVTDVLTLSQVNRQALALKPIELDRLVRDIIEQYPQLNEADIRVIGELPAVLGHGGALTQAISNLLTNAVKFVPENRSPEVEISAETDETSVTLSIRDNGIGIAPEYREQIFGMFNRLHSSEEYEGTGIGLAIVRRAVERMDGSVGVESVEGQGSRFWIKLRRAIQQKAHRRALMQDARK
jgi:PAS domain S-box-containing protein